MKVKITLKKLEGKSGLKIKNSYYLKLETLHSNGKSTVGGQIKIGKTEVFDIEVGNEHMESELNQGYR